MIVDIDEPWKGDLLDRQEAADRLRRYLDESTTVKVLNIDSEWGSGKSYFLQNWYADLKNTRGVVYFNAWENDHISDPFVSLVAAVHDQLQEQTNRSNKIRKSVQATIVAASKIIVQELPGLAAAAVKGKYDIDLGNELAILKSVENASEKAVERLILKQKDTLKSVENFKESLKGLASEVSEWKFEQQRGRGSRLPIYILIDELDRCRPLYSIELLERVKHFFSVAGCRFIIATDTGQLRHSIKAVYGEGFEAEKYLNRFFDVRYTLDNTNLAGWAVFHGAQLIDGSVETLGFYKNELVAHSWESKVLPPSRNVFVFESEEIVNQHVVLITLATAFGLCLRDFISCVQQSLYVKSNVDYGEFDVFWSFFLVSFRFVYPAEYQRFLYDGFIPQDSDIEKDLKRCSFYYGGTVKNVKQVAEVYRHVFTRPNLESEIVTDKDIKVIRKRIIPIKSSLMNYSRYVELAGALN